MIYINNLNLWMILSIISQVSAVSYNQPKFSSNVSWNPNAITFTDRRTIGQYPFDIFINTNNTIYVPNQQYGQIIIWSQQNQTLTTSNSITNSNLTNAYSLFVTISNDIYVDTLNSIGGVSKWTSNLTNGILIMRTCQKCWDLFVDISNMLYCSLGERHQVISKSLNYSTNSFLIVAGTGSPDIASNTLNNPRGIFVDINFDLYVADCGNDRIQLFHSGKLTGITVAGSRSLNPTIPLNCPTGIILDADKYLFIVDHNNHRIVRSGFYGFQCLFGCLQSNGSGSNELNGPWSLSFDSYGNIFVIDQGNNRIQKFLLSTNSSEITNTITTATENTDLVTISAQTSSTAVSSLTSFCDCSHFVLSLTNILVNTLNTTYQWQSSPMGQNLWSNTNAPNLLSTLSVASQNYSTDYQCRIFVSIPLSIILTSTIVTVSSGYCPTSAVDCISFGDTINNFILTGELSTQIYDLNTQCAANSYDNRTHELVKLYENRNYTAYVSTQYALGGEELSIWIDFNDNFLFEASEQVAYVNLIGNSNTSVIIKIPSISRGGLIGVHRMRATLAYSAIPNRCGSSSAYGETHDYTVNILTFVGKFDHFQ